MIDKKQLVGVTAGLAIFCVFLTGVAGASATGVDVVDSNESVTNHTVSDTASTDQSITLLDQTEADSFSDSGITQESAIKFSQNITFDGGNNYSLAVTDEDMGGTVTVTPPEDVTIVPPALNNSGGSPNDGQMAIFIRDGGGDVALSGSMLIDKFYARLDLTTDGAVSTAGIVNQSVALIDAQSGDTIAETGSNPYVVGYNQTVETEVTDAAVEFSLPRDPFPANADVELDVFNTSLGESNTSSASYNSQSDTFEGSLDRSELAPGNYTYRLSVTHPSGINFSVEAKELDSTYENQPPIVIPDGETTNETETTLPGAVGPAQDPDGDGTFEDVNGDGNVDLFDALALYNNRNEPAVENNLELFDFNDDGTVDLFDALALYNEI
jgi:hypothetical protein